jgi:MFS family permease
MAERTPPLLTAPFVRLWLLSLCGSGAGFLIFPTAPFRLRELGAPEEAVGWFLGGLTLGSAAAAAWTGALADVLGRRRVLTTAALLLAACGAAYAAIPSWKLVVALAVPHGVVWSSLLVSGNTELMRLVPEARRAEGIAYFGLATNLSIAIAPALGFLLLARSWTLLCAAIVVLDLAVAGLARAMPDDPPVEPRALHRLLPHRAVDWRTLRVAIALLLLSVGYGGLTSFVAIYAEARGIAPKSVFFTAFAATIIAARPLLGRSIDRRGARRVLPASIVVTAAGLALVPFQSTRVGLVAAAVVFGAGFAILGPAFSSWTIANVDAGKRGAAFGALLAAFDLGIGAGSILFGTVVTLYGWIAAYGGAGALALLAWPYLLWAERRSRFSRERSAPIPPGTPDLELP